MQKVNVTLKDKPVIEIIEPENFRVDPASDWYNPIESSPYLIHLIPMFVQDVLEKMEQGEWKKLSLGQILSATKEDDDTVRLTREEPRTDPLDDSYDTVDDFKIVWVHKYIMRKEGEDYCFYTSGTDYRLTKPKLLSKEYPWLKENERPYLMGKLNI